MGENTFERFIQTQAEIADEILFVERDIQHYSKQEKDLVQMREKQLHKNALGVIKDQKETEYAIHYVQIKLQQKKKLMTHLQDAFTHRSLEYSQKK